MSGMVRKFFRLMQRFVAVFKWEKKIPVIQLLNQQNMLEGKVALIVGGTGGIGFAIAKKFVESGCKVILADTNEVKLKELSSDLDLGHFLKIDLNDVASFDKKCEKRKNFMEK